MHFQPLLIPCHNNLLVLLTALFNVQSYHLVDVLTGEKSKQHEAGFNKPLFRETNPRSPPNWRGTQPSARKRRKLKGLGHAIFGNLSIDQMVLELTKITAQNYRRTLTKHRKKGKPREDMDGQNWRGLKWIAFG